MGDKTTICKHCGGKAKWWNKEIYRSRKGWRGTLIQEWTERWHHCIEKHCGKKYQLHLKYDNYRERDGSYYSAEERRVYKL